jgi:hypothetical protein
MRRGLALSLLALSLFGRAEESIHVLPGLAVEVIPVRLTASIPWPARTEIIAAPSQVWLLARGNIWRIGAAQGALATPLKIDSFARSDMGTFAAVVGDKLGVIAKGMFWPAIDLPESGMRLTGGPGDTLYIYGTHSPARIIRFDGEKAAVLATTAEAITAVTHLGETVVFATGEGVFVVRPGQPPGLLFPLAGHTPLISLAANVDTAEIFASTEDAIYQIDEGRMTQVAQGLGGSLAIVERDVLVADVRRQGIFRLLKRIKP